MNSENSKTSGSYGLLVNLADKINLNRSDNMLLYQILVCTIRTYIKTHTKTINLKYKLHHEMKNLLYCILNQIFKIILNIS